MIITEQHALKPAKEVSVINLKTSSASVFQNDLILGKKQQHLNHIHECQYEVSKRQKQNKKLPGLRDQCRKEIKKINQTINGKTISEEEKTNFKSRKNTLIAEMRCLYAVEKQNNSQIKKYRKAMTLHKIIARKINSELQPNHLSFFRDKHQTMLTSKSSDNIIPFKSNSF